MSRQYLKTEDTSIAKAGLGWVLPFVPDVIGQGRILHGTNDVCAVFVVDKDGVEPRAGKRQQVIDLLRDLDAKQFAAGIELLEAKEPNPEIIPYLVIGPNSTHVGLIHVTSDSPSNKEVRILS
jgi:hypothetical protein